MAFSPGLNKQDESGACCSAKLYVLCRKIPGEHAGEETGDRRRMTGGKSSACVLSDLVWSHWYKLFTLRTSAMICLM